ncbi:hypothetical protein N7478_007139 [Penicillium angulare]|uniref:uncharacterized protein n=1 Tax=Penicillium angulare TaxID=116970 RepID=UPI0025409F16|nr:uncharacterized protein N7478_007139 [Penicillium angulare]KAJ5281767.1 hypothetical protein N7478_007139 [Penicillium angulare]
MERAARVCTTCKARKKGCDKTRPSCGYCTQRGLTCVYDDPIVETEGRRNLAGRNVLWAISPSLSSSSFANTSSLTYSPKSIEGFLRHEVSEVFRITHRTFSEVCDQYFWNFHRWLPVVSQDLLVEATAKHGEQCPPADLSLLIMAMFLVTLDPSDLSKTHIIPPQTLYLEFRISLTRVQSALTASTRLVQAGLLLAAYEYASGRPHAAYVSIGICVRMATILGIDTCHRTAKGDSSGIPSTLKSLEIQNIYWAMIMLERFVRT